MSKDIIRKPRETKKLDIPMRFLKNVRTGVVFPWTPYLAQLKYMLPCDHAGNPAHIADDDPYIMRSEMQHLHIKTSARRPFWYRMRANSTTTELPDFNIDEALLGYQGLDPAQRIDKLKNISLLRRLKMSLEAKWIRFMLKARRRLSLASVKIKNKLDRFRRTYL